MYNSFLSLMCYKQLHSVQFLIYETYFFHSHISNGIIIVGSKEWIPVSEGTTLEQIKLIKSEVVTEETLSANPQFNY